MQITELDVTRAIRFFRAGSAGGPDRITPQHIKDLTTLVPRIGEELMTSLTDFVNMPLKSELPEYIRKIISKER